MITDWQIRWRGEELILGIAVEGAVLDVVSNRERLARCIPALSAPQRGLNSITMGRFGEHVVTLNVSGEEVSIFIDGPAFDDTRVQSAAIWVERTKLLAILDEILRQP